MVNYATKYSNTVDEIIKAGALSDSAINNDYEFTGAQTVKVYSMGTAKMNDYRTSGANRYGTPEELQDETQEMVMSRKRSFSYTIDKTNAVDSPEGVKDAGKSLRRQLDTVVIPEIDTYRFAAIAKGAGFRTFTALSKSNAYETFLAANGMIDDAEMPTVGRVAFVTPDFYNKMKLDDNFTKASDMAQEKIIFNGQIGQIDEVPVVKVPSVRMPAGADFIITNPMATTGPEKINDYRIHEDPPGLAGHLVEGLFYYDAFVLNNKKNMIAVNYGHLGTLTASMTAGESGKGIVTVTGNTNGGKLVYKTASSVTAATLGSDVSSWTELPADGIVSATASHKIAVAVSVDGKAVAASEAITVAVGG